VLGIYRHLKFDQSLLEVVTMSVRSMHGSFKSKIGALGLIPRSVVNTYNCYWWHLYSWKIVGALCKLPHFFIFKFI